jgi:hypothetical protein
MELSTVATLNKYYIWASPHGRLSGIRVHERTLVHDDRMGGPNTRSGYITWVKLL